MRTTRLFSLLVTLCLLLPALPVAAQQPDAVPEPTPPDTYLPLVNAIPEAVETSMDGVIHVGKEPVFDALPKDAATIAAAEALEAAEATLPHAEPDPVKPAAPDALHGWNTVVSQNFEGPFPAAGWSVYDGNGASYGTYYWDDDDYTGYRSGWSAWPANGGPAPKDPYYSTYPNGQRAWMRYGPFSLSDASDALMTWYYWNRTEYRYDWLGVFASSNNVDYYGRWYSGDSAGWRVSALDFNSIPGYGSMVGDSSVWIAFYFYSDATITNRGPFVDDIVVQKHNCSGQFLSEWFDGTPNTSTEYLATTCEPYPFARNWGPYAAVFSEVDTWSLHMNAQVWFPTSKTWTFRALSDDGVNVHVDGYHVIDGMWDHSAQTFYGYRYLAAGYHHVEVWYYENTGDARLEVSWY
jgi:hypothetical protein